MGNWYTIYFILLLYWNFICDIAQRVSFVHTFICKDPAVMHISNQGLTITDLYVSLYAYSYYEINAHWKRINSHCLRSHWMRINCNSHWMHIQSIHFYRWFEAGLKVNCIMMWNNAGIIFLSVIGYMKKPAIRQEITSVTLLLRLGKLLYLLCHV